MISAADYYADFVKPTVAEFEADNSDVRRGMLACMAVLHVLDYVWQNRIPDPQQAWNEVEDAARRAADACLAFQVVRGFALASKHAKLKDRPKRPAAPPGFNSSKHMITTPSFESEFFVGATFLGDEIGGVAVQWGEHEYINLTQALQLALTFLEKEYPEICAPSPGSP